MLQKYRTISVNGRSLPFIDEFVRQGLISHISIIFLLKNISKHTDTRVTISELL